VRIIGAKWQERHDNEKVELYEYGMMEKRTHREAQSYHMEGTMKQDWERLGARAVLHSLRVSHLWLSWNIATFYQVKVLARRS
jgi:hypothetical protein